MATVISNKNLQKYNVNKYNFKVIPLGDTSDGSIQEESSAFVTEEASKSTIGEVDSSALNTSSKESLIESLMQKTDEMSSNFIKLQMRLESKEEDFKLELQKAKEDSFSEGIEAGVAKALNDTDMNMKNSVELFSSSIQKLEERAKEFEAALSEIKKDLINAALDIATEVIKVEIGENSNEIAKLLSEELLKDLKNASKVTLKINPINFGAISESIAKVEHIDIVSDSAVSEGGVIVISDVGNIDSQISKRFQRVKRAALSE